MFAHTYVDFNGRHHGCQSNQNKTVQQSFAIRSDKSNSVDDLPICLHLRDNAMIMITH